MKQCLKICNVYWMSGIFSIIFIIILITRPTPSYFQGRFKDIQFPKNSEICLDNRMLATSSYTEPGSTYEKTQISYKYSEGKYQQSSLIAVELNTMSLLKSKDVIVNPKCIKTTTLSRSNRYYISRDLFEKDQNIKEFTIDSNYALYHIDLLPFILCWEKSNNLRHPRNVSVWDPKLSRVMFCKISEKVVEQNNKMIEFKTDYRVINVKYKLLEGCWQIVDIQ